MNTHSGFARPLLPPFRTIKAKNFLALLLLMVMGLTALPLVAGYAQLVEVRGSVELLEQSGLYEMSAFRETGKFSEAELQDIIACLASLRDRTARLQFYYCLTFVTFLAATAGAILVLRRYFLTPVRLVVQQLRLLRHGHEVGNLPLARIDELQELLDMMMHLNGYLTELAEFSDKLTQEKSRFEDMSLKDGLTGVANRRNFDRRLGREQRGAAIGILMIDVDKFKNYNDSLGHQAGDVCLVKLAAAMQSTLFRSTDAVFRYGGEEFTVILENVNADQAAEMARRIKDRVESLRMPHPSSSVSPHVTISIGVAVASKGDAVFSEELVRQADKALYRAKNCGRNRVCLYDEARDGQTKID